MKDGLLGLVSVQREASFGGVPSGEALAVAGLREFDYRFEPLKRQTKISFVRHESAQSRTGAFYRGRMDVELASVSSLDVLVANLLRRVSSTTSDGLTTNVYRRRGPGQPSIESLRFLLSYEGGPWLLLRGVVLTGLRFTVRARMPNHASVDFVAASVTQQNEDPEWKISHQNTTPLVAAGTEVQIDESAVSNAIEFTAVFESRSEPAKVRHDGAVGRFTRQGITVLSGSFTEYGDSMLPIPPKVRDGDEIRLDVTMRDKPETDRILLSIPRAALQSGQPSPVGRVDVMSNIAFRALSGSVAEEPTLAIVFSPLLFIQALGIPSGEAFGTPEVVVDESGTHDSFNSYDDEVELAGLAGGVGWDGNWEAYSLDSDPVLVPFAEEVKSEEPFNSYDDEAELDGLNLGDGWGAAWKGYSLDSTPVNA